MFEAKFQSFDTANNRQAAKLRLEALRKLLARLNLQGFLVPRADEHQGEYVPACDERLAWLTGFTGSAGCAVVFTKTAAIFSDGRYTLQIRQQVDIKLFAPVGSHVTPLAQWLTKNIPEGSRLGYDPRLHTPAEIDRLAKAILSRKAELIAVEENPVDHVWTDRPALPSGMISVQPLTYAGKSAADKLNSIQESLVSSGVDALLVSDPHNVAWAFNIRGSDIPHSPIALSYALIPAHGPATLFASTDKISVFVRSTLVNLVEIATPDEISVALRQAAQGRRKIRLDTATAGIFFKTLVERSGGVADVGPDPITAMKAPKNEAEIQGARAAHLRDGIAMCRFLYWLDLNAGNANLTEIDTVCALETCRRDTGKLKDISFPTISGMGPNGAIVHYRVSRESNRVLGKGLFLIDSGGQYEDGTTDITRTISIGKPTAEQKDRFTRVLKGMIAISSAVFPNGTSGAQLDTLARQFLWEAGLDFDHGTGHGVGSYLSVHEGPQRIAKTGAAILEPGMILSNEPGYYKQGRYGIRIENLVLVERRSFKHTELEVFGFETLTLAPIDRRLIATRLLSRVERDWLNSYHARVYREIEPSLKPDERRWLKDACAKL